MKIITGDLLANTSGILVQGCNCQGRMGSGIAKSIRSQYADVYDRYVEKHRRSGLQLGDVQFVWSAALAKTELAPVVARHLSLTDRATHLPSGLIVANAMTQEFYGTDKDVTYVDYGAVFSAFARIRLVARDFKMPVRFPLIGAGLAHGKWPRIAQAIEAGLREQWEQAELWVQPGAELPEGLVPAQDSLLGE